MVSFWSFFESAMNFQKFTEIETFVQKCSRGAQNDGKTLKIILYDPHEPIWGIPVHPEQKMQKIAFLMEKPARNKQIGLIFQKSWKFQVFREIEIFAQKCSRGAQNDGKTLKIIW